MYPTNPQYRHSIINKMYPPSNGGLKFTAVYENDEPKYESGNKAIVFKVKDDRNEKTKALKLFLIENKERFSHYLEISKFLNKFKSTYFVSFDFIEKLIYVEVSQDPDNNYFPGLVMEWAEGKTLGYKIREFCYKNDRKNLIKLTDSFKEISYFLIDNNIGHGDLKHDNIIVDENNMMKLIDYDGIYVPAFNNQISKELGTDSFQHPLRKSIDFNANIDHFSILTIYTSLIALSNNPDLFVKYNDQQNLIFTKEDFLNPDDSELFRTLSKMKEVQKLIYCIKQSLKSDSIYIDNIKDILNGIFPKPTIVISHSPEIPLEGNEVTISWVTENTESVKIDGKEYPINGKITEKYFSSKKINFEIENYFEKEKHDFEIKLIPIPKIKELRAKHQKIEFGKETELVWEIENVEKVELHYAGNLEVISNKGNKVISPSDDTTYKIIFTALDGTTIEEKTVKVQVYKRTVINNFSSSMDFIMETLSFDLSWDVEHFQEIKLYSNKGFLKYVTDQKNISIEAKKGENTFWIEAKNDLFNVLSEKIKIKVDEIPIFEKFNFNIGKIDIPQINLMEDFNFLTQEQSQKKSSIEKILSKEKFSFDLLSFVDNIFKK